MTNYIVRSWLSITVAWSVFTSLLLVVARRLGGKSISRLKCLFHGRLLVFGEKHVFFFVTFFSCCLAGEALGHRKQPVFDCQVSHAPSSTLPSFRACLCSAICSSDSTLLFSPCAYLLHPGPQTPFSAPSSTCGTTPSEACRGKNGK